MARCSCPYDHHQTGAIEKRGDKWRARIYVDGGVSVGLSRFSRGEAFADLHLMRFGNDKPRKGSDANFLAAPLESHSHGWRAKRRMLEPGLESATLRDKQKRRRLREDTTNEQVGWNR